MTTSIKEGTVETEIKDGIASITFAHPSSNAMPGQQLKALAEAIHAAGRDTAVKVVIIRSGGERAFCAGASFDELLAIRDLEGGKAFFRGFAGVINAMRSCPKFIIVRLQGKAVGGGVGIAAAADYCIASEYASVKLSELAIGIGPFVIGPAVERKIGKAAFTQLAIAATEWQTAAWAKDKGLYQDVFPTIERTDAYVEYLAKQLAAYSPEAMAKMKAMFWEGTDHWPELLEERAKISGQLVLSDFTSAAIAAFKNKKK
ncbi:enoyl-CoA hydratase/isomerase family protein [Flavilitoribacter nigricans]|uniref:Enoyl-CoA hydratase n=1 Tax=Flavilitoribacter nigricans (strain ATCC 23147 / DSM 23189 / NBRC 102662 / NCIMB 1420 / SS-2) TaxID=1122177 RepID=A0A2D0NF64_FLAN2|nr:enoyl-CoA hydratase/isomerase family protein [Flavilitoribacter nigricans]PHN07151.1 enoyl-CoA hydratase [Flavilitoribacter nigricans DSM 23189 = NBRC 102662]